MDSQRASQTADGVAALRAYHLLRESPCVFEDPLALRLTSPRYRILLLIPPLRWLVVERLRGWMAGIRGQVLARARYAEDELARAVASGVGQYVIVSAGLDSFAWRRPDTTAMRSLRVFELDHPASQAAKRDRLRRADLQIPEGVHLVPVDFERETLEKALLSSGFDPSKRAFFSWLGTVAYLSEEAICATLDAIAAVAEVGSQLVFDYAVPLEEVPAADRRALLKLAAKVGRVGEPIRTLLAPHQVRAMLESRGFRLLEELSPQGQVERYFSDRNDHLRPLRFTYFVKAELGG